MMIVVDIVVMFFISFCNLGILLVVSLLLLLVVLCFVFILIKW